MDEGTAEKRQGKQAMAKDSGGCPHSRSLMSRIDQ